MAPTLDVRAWESCAWVLSQCRAGRLASLPPPDRYARRINALLWMAKLTCRESTLFLSTLLQMLNCDATSMAWMRCPALGVVMATYGSLKRSITDWARTSGQLGTGQPHHATGGGSNSPWGFCNSPWRTRNNHRGALAAIHRGAMLCPPWGTV